MSPATVAPADGVAVHGHGPAVLLCQGLGLPARVWDRVVTGLAQDHTVVTFDRPGLGRSTRPQTPGMTLAGEVERAVRALRGVSGAGDRPAVLVGHSMGGLVVEGLARRHPALASGIVLVDGSTEEPPFRGLVAPAVWNLAGSLAGRVPIAGRWLAAAAFESGSFHRMAADLDRMRATSLLPPMSVRIVVAMSLLKCGSTRWVRRQQELARRLAADHPLGPAGVTTHIVSGSGHLVMRDRPDAVIDAVRATTRAVPRTGLS